jgi:hypothetical protein
MMIESFDDTFTSVDIIVVPIVRMNIMPMHFVSNIVDTTSNVGFLIETFQAMMQVYSSLNIDRHDLPIVI